MYTKFFPMVKMKPIHSPAQYIAYSPYIQFSCMTSRWPKTSDMYRRRIFPECRWQGLLKLFPDTGWIGVITQFQMPAGTLAWEKFSCHPRGTGLRGRFKKYWSVWPLLLLLVLLLGWLRLINIDWSVYLIYHAHSEAGWVSKGGNPLLLFWMFLLKRAKV